MSAELDRPRWRVSLHLSIQDAAGHGHTEKACQTVSANSALEAVVLATASEVADLSDGNSVVAAMPFVRPEDDDLPPAWSTDAAE